MQLCLLMVGMLFETTGNNCEIYTITLLNNNCHMKGCHMGGGYEGFLKDNYIFGIYVKTTEKELSCESLFLRDCSERIIRYDTT